MKKFKGVIQMEKGTVAKVSELEGFSLPGDEEKYISKNVVDKENCNSKKIQINHFTLKAGKSIEGGLHPCPYDEIYYILHGYAMLTLGEDKFKIGPDTAIYIPCDTFHKLDNTEGKTDLELLTIWHLPIREGANEIYDARKKEWGGTSFKRAD
jgi:mannose-6-phosphate isomerase-like protein (cupin superfamily)